MNAHVEELAKEIRSLPEEARLYLIDQIMESLEVAEVERAWEVELDRREADIKSGREPLLDGEKVMAELQSVARKWRRE